MLDIQKGKPKELKSKNGMLVVSFSSKRAHNDKKNRIEAHICICFSAYAVYKERERLLRKIKSMYNPRKQ